MSRIKLVVLDLDGTLLWPDHSLSAENAAAVRACRERGVEVTLASGRSFQAMRKYAEALAITSPIIALNGGTTIEPQSGAIHVKAMLSPAQVQHISAMLLEQEIPFVIFGVRAIYALPGMVDRNIMTSYDEPPITEVSDLRAIPDPLKVLSFLEASSRDAELLPLVAGVTDQVRSGPLFLEWLPFNINKGSALQDLMQERGLHPDEVLAIGDGQNDMSMLQVAGISVAMGNAPAEVSACAKYHTTRCEENGVAAALRRFVLG